MPRKPDPDAPYRVAIHIDKGYRYASTQPAVVDPKTGKRTYHRMSSSRLVDVFPTLAPSDDKPLQFFVYHQVYVFYPIKRIDACGIKHYPVWANCDRRIAHMGKELFPYDFTTVIGKGALYLLTLRIHFRIAPGIIVQFIISNILNHSVPPIPLLLVQLPAPGLTTPLIRAC